MIGKRVQEIRKRKGYSLSELAEQAGVSKSYLSTIEREVQSNPSIQFLEKIAAVLNVPLDTFLHPNEVSDEDTLDEEWAQLVRDAMNSGVSKEEFRDFLEFSRWRLNRSKK